ncbi:MAG: hypothetical protein ACRDQW_03880 [Haloechinothrix sp.]
MQSTARDSPAEVAEVAKKVANQTPARTARRPGKSPDLERRSEQDIFWVADHCQATSPRQPRWRSSGCET